MDHAIQRFRDHMNRCRATHVYITGHPAACRDWWEDQPDRAHRMLAIIRNAHQLRGVDGHKRVLYVIGPPPVEIIDMAKERCFKIQQVDL